MIARNIGVPFGCAWSPDERYVLTNELLIDGTTARSRRAPGGGDQGYLWSPRRPNVFAYWNHRDGGFFLNEIRPGTLTLTARPVMTAECARTMGPAYPAAEQHLQQVRGRGYTDAGSGDLLLSPDGRFSLTQGMFKRFGQAGEEPMQGDRVLADLLHGNRRVFRCNLPYGNHVRFVAWAELSNFVLGVCETFDEQVLPRLALLDVSSRRIAYARTDYHPGGYWANVRMTDRRVQYPSEIPAASFLSTETA